MGCDIHLFTEVKIRGEWLFYGQIHMPRNYELFSLMAGIRGNRQPIVSPKGIPSDLSCITRIHYMDYKSDLHHASWFNQEEIEKLMKYIRGNEELYFGEKWLYIIGWLFGNSYHGIAKYKSDYPDEIEDCRWIFWFDN